MSDVITPSDDVYRYDDNQGVWRHIPGGDIAAAMGIDWGNLERMGGDPDPIGNDWTWDDLGGQPQAQPDAPPTDTSFDYGRYANGLTDLIDPSGNVYRYNVGVQSWLHIPDVPTANAMGVNWNGLVSVPGQPQPYGGDWQPVGVQPPSAPAPVITEPAQSFTFYGRSWQRGDLDVFLGALAAHGIGYADWAAKHTDAALIIEGPPDNPNREALPKSLGEALQSSINAGASASEAAAQAEALRAALVAAGTSSVTPGQLLNDAHVVQQAFVAEGGIPPQPPTTTPEPQPPTVVQPPDDGSDDDATRTLQSVGPYKVIIHVPGNLFDFELPGASNGKATAVSSWNGLMATLAGRVSDNLIASRAASSRFLSKVR